MSKKNKIKVNEQALKGWISPSVTELRPKKYNMQFGTPIMTEEEFNKIMFDEQYMALSNTRRLSNYNQTNKKYNFQK